MPIIDTPAGTLEVTNAILSASEFRGTQKISVSNSAPTKNFSVGDKFHVSTTDADAVNITGNLVAQKLKIGNLLVSPTFDLAAVSNVGNTTSNTLQFANATTSFVASSNVEIGGNITLTSNAQVKVGSNVLAEYTGPHGREPKEMPIKKYPEIVFEDGKFDANDSTNTYVQAGYTVTASSSGFEENGFAPWKVFNQDNGKTADNAWHTAGNPAAVSGSPYNTIDSSYVGEWLKIELPKAIKLSHVSIASRNAFASRQPPSKYRVYGSNNDSTWVQLIDADNVVYAEEVFTTKFSTTTNYYKYLALVIQKGTIDTGVTIGEIQYYGAEEPAPPGDLSLDTTLKSTFNSVRSNNYVMYFDGDGFIPGDNTSNNLVTGSNKSVIHHNATYDSTGKYWTLDGSTESNVTTGSLGFEGDVPHTVSTWINASNLEANALTQQLFSIGSGYDKAFLKVDDTQIAANTWHNVTYAYQGEGGSKVTYVDGRKVEEAQVEDTFGAYPPIAMTDYKTGGYCVSASSVYAPSPDYPAWEAFDHNTTTTGSQWICGVGFYENNGTYTGTTSTVESSNTWTGEYLQIELPYKIRVSDVQILREIDATYGTSRSPNTGAILGSNDGYNWSYILNFTNKPHTDYSGTVFTSLGTSSGTDSYKYLRLVVTKIQDESVTSNSNGNLISITELKYYGHKEGDLTRFPEPTRVLKYPHVTMTGPGQRGYVVTETSALANTEAYRGYNAFDEKTGDTNANFHWLSHNSYDNNGDLSNTATILDVTTIPVSGSGTEVVEGEWIQVELPHKILLSDIAMERQYTPGNDQYGQKRAPRDGALLGSNDGTTWKTIHKFTGLNATDWPANTLTKFNGTTRFGTISTSSPNYVAYKYFRLVVQKTNPDQVASGNAVHATIREIQLLGTQENTETPMIVGGPFAGKVANFRVYDQYLGDERIQEIYDAQKDEFGHKKSSMTFYKGRIGVGTTEPEGALTVIDEPHALTKFPARAISADESYDEGIGQIKLSVAEGTGYRAFDGLTSTSWTATPTRNTRVSEEVDFGAWLKIQTPESMSLKKAEIESKPDWRQVGSTINDSAEHAANSSSFGMALDCSDDGTRIIVGAYHADVSGTNRGQAFVFDWNGSDWVKVGNTLQGTQNDEHLGYAVAISGDGNYIAVGNPFYNTASLADAGRYGVFYLSGATWTILPDSGALTSPTVGEIDYFVGTAASEKAGFSLSLSYDGKTIVAGYRGNVSGAGSDAGQIRVHTYTNGAWGQKGQALSGLESGDRLGENVKITSDGNHLIAGASYGAKSEVYVYDYNSSTSQWVKRTTLAHPTLPNANTHFYGSGIAISDDGNTVAVGASGDDTGGTNYGRVYMYSWSGSAWTLVSTLANPLQGTNNEYFGTAVDLSGDGTRLVAAAAYENNQQGYAFTYEYNGGSWHLRNHATIGSAGVGTNGRLGEFYTGLIISRDGSTIVGGDRAGTVGKARVFNMPSNIKSIWGSNDDVNWTKITTGNETFRGNDRLEFKNLDNPNYYKYHAIVADAFTQLKDIKLFGVRNQGSSTLHDGTLTLTKNLDVPRIGPPPDADDTPRRDRLVVEYNTHKNPMEDGLLQDTSGRGLDGVLMDGAYYDATEKALVFDGNADNISGTIPGVSGEYVHSITLWVKIKDDLVYTLFEMGARSTDDLIGISISSSTINYYFYSNDNSYTGITPGSWHHLTFTYSGGSDLSNRKLYINGNEVSRTTHGGGSTGALTLANGNFTIGDIVGGTGNNDFKGSISQFKLYDCALTAEEVKTLYDMGRCDEGGHTTTVSRSQLRMGGENLVIEPCIKGFYEEGTWVPYIAGSTSGVCYPSGSNYGWFIRVGNLVTIGGTVAWSGYSGAISGNKQIMGLPYPARNVPNARTAMTFGVTTSTGLYNGISGGTVFRLIIDPGYNFIYIASSQETAGGYSTYSVSATHVDNDGLIYGLGGTYRI